VGTCAPMRGPIPDVLDEDITVSLGG
jgi:hypothetical protein